MRRVKSKLPFLPFFGALPVRRRRFSTVFGQDAEEKLHFLLCLPRFLRPQMAYSLFS
ncbi:hypothetical protein SUBVAR_06649 [Subdoligranulum variabile DSM 15176]|uniref:Uncharacterized protein n=1 Tax=Subdoligranulum variabile DSM 15176 TaxID=411471 RepID=D1PQI0_9FIRM|nr:hypothetical protein SUBVAR_06649 [Subdoligranulum variabile DSM 15176]